MLTAPFALLLVAVVGGEVEVRARTTGCFHHAETTTTIDGARWYDPIVDGQPALAFADQGHGERWLDKFVTPAWRDAGFAGEPEIELALGNSPNDWPIKVYLSQSDPRALIVRAGPPKKGPPSAHWLDALEISFHTKTPTYAVVQRDGAHEVRTIAR